jgi:hypothetical protein
MRRALSLLTLMLACMTAPAMAAPPAKPAMTGIWMIQPAYYLGKPLLPAPKLTDPVKALAARNRKANEAGYVREVSGMLCGQNGALGMFQIRSPFEIFSGFGRMTIIFETEMNNQPRTIYMDQKVQPENIYPSYNGHSIGHWEGKTLVIDTVGFIDRGNLLGPVPRSLTTHTVERLTVSADGKVLTNQITITDPATLTAPWITTIAFDRKPTTEERFEVWCDADLEAFKTLDLNALKDADPEVARLLTSADIDPAVRIAKDAEAAKK